MQGIASVIVDDNAVPRLRDPSSIGNSSAQSNRSEGNDDEEAGTTIHYDVCITVHDDQSAQLVQGYIRKNLSTCNDIVDIDDDIMETILSVCSKYYQ